jgi:hypothetical protein
VSGLVKGGEWGHIATLPEGFRPRARLCFNAQNHENITRVDVYPDGTIRYVAGGKNHGHVALDGICFHTSNGQLDALPLANGWVDYGNVYAGATYHKQDGLVTVSGLVKGGKWGHIATLPEGFRPRARLCFNAQNHENMSRVDVYPDGTIRYVAGGKDHGHVALDGIRFRT